MSFGCLGVLYVQGQIVESFQNNIEAYKLDIFNPTWDVVEKKMSFIHASLMTCYHSIKGSDLGVDLCFGLEL